MIKQPWFDRNADGVMMSKRCAGLITRIFKRCKVADRGYDTLCYEWQGATSGYGRGGHYGRVKVDGYTSAVHRVIWSCFNGYISPKRDIDHLCRNRICCRPDHLESVTSIENQRRKAIVYDEIIKGER